MWLNKKKCKRTAVVHGALRCLESLSGLFLPSYSCLALFLSFWNKSVNVGGLKWFLTFSNFILKILKIQPFLSIHGPTNHSLLSNNLFIN